MSSTASCPAVTDEKALAALIDEHRSALMVYAVRLTGGDHAWAEDVVQEVFVRAWRHLDRMTPEHGSVRSWLFRVAHNLAVDGHRSRRARPIGAEQVEAGIGPADDASADVLDAIEIGKALADLSAAHRAVLVELYLHDRKLEDTARQLRVPVGTVKSRAFYALRQLRITLSVPSRAS